MTPEENFRILYVLAFQRMSDDTTLSLRKQMATLSFYEEQIKNLLIESDQKSDTSELEKRYNEIKGRCGKLKDEIEMIKMSLKSAKNELKGAFDEIPLDSSEFQDCRDKYSDFDRKSYEIISSTIDSMIGRVDKLVKNDWKKALYNYKNHLDEPGSGA